LLSIGPCEKRLLRMRNKGVLVAALIDPDDFTEDQAANVTVKAQELGVSCVFVGGSTVADQSQLERVVISIKKHITLPVILFPGNITGVSKEADAILFSSLLNSTNPYFIIGAQAIGSVQVRKSNLEAIPMGYLVFGEQSSTGFVAQVNGIPLDKPSLAVMYALAARYLGMRTLYLEAGSGSTTTIPTEVISSVRKHFPGLLIVGGGITNAETAKRISKAGADILVIGNMLQREHFEPILSQIVKATAPTL
jgi:phosphoglycerol geranylgeranyltransferase